MFRRTSIWSQIGGEGWQLCYNQPSFTTRAESGDCVICTFFYYLASSVFFNGEIYQTRYQHFPHNSDQQHFQHSPHNPHQQHYQHFHTIQHRPHCQHFLQNLLIHIIHTFHTFNLQSPHHSSESISCRSVTF